MSYSAPTASSALAARKAMSSASLSFVDDTRVLAEEALGDFGAVEALREEQPDAVVGGIRMQRTNGGLCELTDRARQPEGDREALDRTTLGEEHIVLRARRQGST